jgi:hypothetical protein
VAVTTLAVERSVASLWLPVVGDGPSRQHVASIIAAVAGDVALVAIAVRGAVRGAARSSLAAERLA